MLNALMLVLLAAAGISSAHASFTSEVNMIQTYQSKKRDACEADLFPIQLELAQMLDDKLEWLLKNASVRDPNQNVYLPETTDRENNTIITLGWRELHRLAKGLRKPDHRQWVGIYRQMNGLINQEKRRLSGNYDYTPELADSLAKSFNRNDGVERISRKVFRLNVDLGELRTGNPELLNEIKNLIPQIVNTGEYRLELNDIPYTEGSMTYRVTYQNQPGDVAITDTINRRMTLVNGMKPRAAVHEIMHAVGLPDRYFTVWIPQKCAYEVRLNQYDLMSMLDSGTILPSDWSLLDKMYLHVRRQ